MTKTNHTRVIAELSASEGVFTTAQADRMGITRDALHDAVESGRIERIIRGAYRFVGAQASETDELAALWQLTNPSRFTWERMKPGAWDGIVIGGSTAASLQRMGDFFASPYRIYTPKRINSRNKAARFSTRKIDAQDVTWVLGIPLTRPERTLVDLCLDSEDPSLIADAYRDAERAGFDFERLSKLVKETERNLSKGLSLRPLFDLMDATCKEPKCEK